MTAAARGSTAGPNGAGIDGRSGRHLPLLPPPPSLSSSSSSSPSLFSSSSSPFFLLLPSSSLLPPTSSTAGRRREEPGGQTTGSRPRRGRPARWGRVAAAAGEAGAPGPGRSAGRAPAGPSAAGVVGAGPRPRGRRIRAGAPAGRRGERRRAWARLARVLGRRCRRRVVAGTGRQSSEARERRTGEARARRSARAAAAAADSRRGVGLLGVGTGRPF